VTGGRASWPPPPSRCSRGSAAKASGARCEPRLIRPQLSRAWGLRQPSRTQHQRIAPESEGSCIRSRGISACATRVRHPDRCKQLALQAESGARRADGRSLWTEVFVHSEPRARREASGKSLVFRRPAKDSALEWACTRLDEAGKRARQGLPRFIREAVCQAMCSLSGAFHVGQPHRRSRPGRTDTLGQAGAFRIACRARPNAFTISTDPAGPGCRCSR